MKNLFLIFVLINQLVAGQFFESNTVYEALLNQQFERNKDLVIQSKSNLKFIYPEDFDLYRDDFESLEKETFDDFIKNNSHPKYLRIQSGKNIKYISLLQVKFIFRDEEGWDRFYKKYPNAPGIITLSNIGFNSTRTQALVYIGNQKGWLDGVGIIVLLELEKGQWKLIKLRELWVS